jgi:serine protease AprX
MRTQSVVVLAVLIATALLAAALPTRSKGAGATSAAPAKADVIVRFAPTVRPAQRRAVVRAAGGTVTRDLHLIDGLGASMTREAATRLRTAMGVRSVSFAAPVASRAETPGNAYTAAIGARTTWHKNKRTGLSGAGVGVAVVDTGIAGDLPDFQAKRGKRGGSRVAASVVVNPRATSAADAHGHGTHVAGIIGGDGTLRPGPKKRAFVGVAPGASLVSIKISDDQGRASTLDAIYGIQFAVDHADELGIRVINLSLASTEAESPATDPLAAAAEAAWLDGLVVVAAAGNAGDARKAVAYAPGNDPYVITVGATDDMGTVEDTDDRTEPWSSHGKTQTGVSKPEIVAPGSHIVSTLAPGSAFASLCPECIVDEHYFQAGGTSMASAVVSGAVALMLEAHPDWTPDQVKAALVGTATGVPGGRQVRVDKAIADAPDPAAVTQTFKLNKYLDAKSGDIDYTAASWRAASWRAADRNSPHVAGWAAASWRCDCSLTEDGEIDPQAASWRAASWRTGFKK